VIEPTDEMIYAFAGEPEITATDAHAIRVGLAAVLAIVDRDRCPERRGHVWHPLDKTPPALPKKCGSTRWGMPCDRPDGHPGNHLHTASRSWG
jgi:hypothetical protein